MLEIFCIASYPAYTMLGKASSYFLRLFKQSGKNIWLKCLAICHRLGFGGPVGIYQIADQDMICIEPAQPCQPAHTDSLRAKSKLHQDQFQPWPIFYAHLPHVRLVGQNLLVINQDHKVLYDCIFRNEANIQMDTQYHYFNLPKPVLLGGAWTSVVSRWSHHSNYYHWLFDALPRLACLNQFPADTKILVPNNLANFQIDSLRQLDVFERCHPTGEQHLIIEDYWHSSSTAMTGCHNPYAVNFLRSALLKNSHHAPRKKIYISRRNSPRSAFNEFDLETLLSQMGWTIVTLEKLTFQQQIELFSNATAVCGIHGAGMTNIVWCSPNCKILELCASSFLNGVYEGIADCLNLDYHYLTFPSDNQHRFYIDLDSVKRYWQDRLPYE